jgi:hypothetical protein
MAGASFVAVTQLATREYLSIAHLFALGCFALCLPIAISFAVWPEEYLRFTPPEDIDNRIKRGDRIATFAFMGGVLMLFFSFSIIVAGVLVIGFLIASHIDGGISRTKKERDENKSAGHT